MSSSSSALLTTSTPTYRAYHAQLMTSSGLVNVGSRASTLAMIQSTSVVENLSRFYPEIQMPIQKITTTGDKILGVPLSKIGEKALFTKELEVALEDNSVDIVVHSLKDLPTTLPPGMCIGAVLKRDSPYDACIMSKSSLDLGHTRLSDLPTASVVGTSSLRRIAQLKRLHPGLIFQDVRGNLNTRMKKLDGEWENANCHYSALILAESGMSRMGPSWVQRITRSIPTDECMYAVGQGALAVECREDDFSTLSLLSILHHESTVYRVVAERALLKVLEGGCSAPVAVSTDMNDDLLLTLQGGVFSLDGSEAVVTSLSVDLAVYLDIHSQSEQPTTAKTDPSRTSSSSKRRRSMRTFAGIVAGDLSEAAMDAAEKLGVDVAKRLKELGAGPILKAAKDEVEKGREESERMKREALEKDEAEKTKEESEKRKREALEKNEEEKRREESEEKKREALEKNEAEKRKEDSEGKKREALEKNKEEKRREDSEGKKREALEKNALKEAKRKEEEAVAGGGDAEVTKNVATNS